MSTTGPATPPYLEHCVSSSSDFGSVGVDGSRSDEEHGERAQRLGVTGRSGCEQCGTAVLTEGDLLSIVTMVEGFTLARDNFAWPHGPL